MDKRVSFTGLVVALAAMVVMLVQGWYVPFAFLGLALTVIFEVRGNTGSMISRGGRWIYDRARTLGSKVVVLAVIVGVVAALAGTAAAHTIGNTSYMYRTGDLCVTAGAFMYHDGATPHVAVGVESDRGTLGLWGFEWDCAWAYERPATWLALYWQLYKWTGSEWIVCAGAGWYQNGAPASQMSREYQAGWRPCGYGYYGVYGAGYVWDGGTWQGGWNWAGYEWLA